MPRRKKRLDPAAFNLPVEQIKSGFFTDTYFVRSRDVLRAEGRSPRVLMQVTGKQVGYLGGIDASIAAPKRIYARPVFRAEPRRPARRRSFPARADAGDGEAGRIPRRTRRLDRRAEALRSRR